MCSLGYWKLRNNMIFNGVPWISLLLGLMANLKARQEMEANPQGRYDRADEQPLSMNSTNDQDAFRASEWVKPVEKPHLDIKTEVPMDYAGSVIESASPVSTLDVYALTSPLAA
jgi:hypothetical protein